MTRSSSDGNVHYLLPVLWMMLHCYIMEWMGQNQRAFVQFARWRHRWRSVPSPTASRCYSEFGCHYQCKFTCRENKRPHVVHKMRPTVTDVARSMICVSVCWSHKCTVQKRPDNTQNCSFPWGDLDPYLLYGSLNQHESASHPMALPFSIGSAVFPQHICVTNRHTDHAMCNICSNRPHLMQCR